MKDLNITIVYRLNSQVGHGSTRAAACEEHKRAVPIVCCSFPICVCLFDRTYRQLVEHRNNQEPVGLNPRYFLLIIFLFSKQKQKQKMTKSVDDVQET